MLTGLGGCLTCVPGADACLGRSARSRRVSCTSPRIPSPLLSVFAPAANSDVPVKPPERRPDHWVLVPASGYDSVAGSISGTALTEEGVRAAGPNDLGGAARRRRPATELNFAAAGIRAGHRRQFIRRSEPNGQRQESWKPPFEDNCHPGPKAHTKTTCRALRAPCTKGTMKRLRPAVRA
jgi:hypothetical protein